MKCLVKKVILLFLFLSPPQRPPVRPPGRDVRPPGVHLPRRPVRPDSHLRRPVRQRGQTGGEGTGKGHLEQVRPQRGDSAGNNQSGALG